MPWLFNPLSVLCLPILMDALGITNLPGWTWHDPVLLGALVAPGRSPVPGEPAAWFYLGHWAFNEEVPPWSPST